MKEAHKKLNKLNSNLEIVLDENSTLKRCEDVISMPKKTLAFVLISEITNYSDSLDNIIGIVVHVGYISTVHRINASETIW